MFTFLFNAIYYLVSLTIAIFFLLLGIIAMILPWSPKLRTDLILLLLENSIAVSLFGFGFLIIGAAWFVNLWSSTKRQYYYCKAGDTSIAIDESLLQYYLEDYWERQFPKQQVPTRVVLKKNKINIDADLPFTRHEERKEFIAKTQHDLREILERIFGYKQDFSLSISFKKANH